MRSKAREIDIQPGDPVAFIHLPKTAGTTFNAILEPRLSGLTDCPEYFLTGLVQSDLDELRKLQLFRGHFPYALFSDIIFPEGFIGLTFLRDPVQRTMSNYKFMEHLLTQDHLLGLQQYADEFEQIKHLSLPGLLARTDLKINRDWVNFQTGFLGSSMEPSLRLPAFLLKLFPGRELMLQDRYSRLRSRVNDIYVFGKYENKDVTRTTLNLARQRLKEIAFLGLVERFQDSLFLLSYTFGWRPIPDATHLNVTPEKDKWKPADPEALARIRDMVRLDLELYQFGQDIFEGRFNDMTQALLRRYGKKEHAKLRGPLPVDVMMQFLEQNYLDRRDRRVRQDGAPADDYLYQPGMKVEGPFGWYPPD